jgi:hypothetical protein
MGWIQTGIGTGKTEARVAAQQFMQERSAGTPESENKNRRLWHDRGQSIRITAVLDSVQDRLGGAAQPVEGARAASGSTAAGVNLPSQVSPGAA